MVFEIVSSEGDVDETFHDDEKYGNCHTLVIKSDLFDIDDSLRYRFRYGYCKVRALTVTQNEEGTACFIAAHSRHPELFVSFKVSKYE